MPGVAPDRFVQRIRRLSPVARREFIAAIWTARGFETVVEDEIIIAHKAGETVRVTVPNRKYIPEKGIFGTINTDGIDRMEPYTVDSVWHELKYSIDESNADSLSRHFLNEPLESVTRTEHHHHSRRDAVVPVAIMIAVVIVIGIPVVLGTGLVLDATTDERSGASDPNDQASLPSVVEGEANKYPPGIDQSGMVDPSAHVAGHLDLAERPMGGLTDVRGPAQPKRFDGEPYITPAGNGNWIWTVYRLALLTEHVRVEWHMLENQSVETLESGLDSGSTEVEDDRLINTTDAAEPKVRERLDMERDEWFQITAQGDVDATHFHIENLDARSYVSPDGRIIYFIVTFEYPDEDERVVIEFFGE